MNPAANQRIAPGRVLLILVGLLAIWLIFQFWPQAKPAPASVPVAAESKLRSVGLPDNVDLEGLPEMFAVWVPDWKGDKLTFGYWNPIRRDYSYRVVATWTTQGVRFKLLEKNEGMVFIPVEQPTKPGLDGEPFSLYSDDLRSPEHPFDFSGARFEQLNSPHEHDWPSSPRGVTSPGVMLRKTPPKVPIDLTPTNPLSVPNSSPPKTQTIDGKR